MTLSKAEQYQQACEAMRAASPEPITIGATRFEVSPCGGLSMYQGLLGTHWDKEQSLHLLAFLRATFEEPQDDVAEDRRVDRCHMGY